MAEIVQNAPAESAGNTLTNFLGFLAQYWWVFVVFAVIAGLIILAFYIWKKKEENDRRRDSAVYATAQNLREAAELNANTSWMRRSYSLWNLCWLGLPLKWNEHSMTLRNIDRQVLGWYRGHTYAQNGDLIVSFYKTKFLFFFEQKMLVYLPMSFINEGKSYKLPSDCAVFDERDHELRIKCTSLVRQGNYYLFPSYVFVKENEKHAIDLTQHIADAIARTNYLVQLETSYADMSRAVGRAVEMSPGLRMVQKEPEKEKEIDEPPQSTQ